MSSKLSAKAAALLADLQANVSETRKSQYIEGLVESAAKRKKTSELALERKIAREEQEGTAPTMSFVTRAYEEKMQQARESTGEPSSARDPLLLRKAERIDAYSSSLSGSKSKQPTSTSTSSMPTISVSSTAYAHELIKRREARRSARLAPTSRLTPEMIEEAKQRARERLGIAD